MRCALSSFAPGFLVNSRPPLCTHDISKIELNKIQAKKQPEWLQPFSKAMLLWLYQEGDSVELCAAKHSSIWYYALVTRKEFANCWMCAGNSVGKPFSHACKFCSGICTNRLKQGFQAKKDTLAKRGAVLCQAWQADTNEVMLRWCVLI